METSWDCVVVGGGAAGLSAALVLGRARQRTLVIDAGGQSNNVAHGIGGLLGHDGRPPAEFYAIGRSELAKYPTVALRNGTVVSGSTDSSGSPRFTLILGDGTSVTTRRVMLTTGMDYRLPNLPGVAERWGESVFHCPFCHGWEVRDQALAVLDNGATGVHRAVLLGMWSDNVTLLSNGTAELDAEQMQALHSAGVTVDERQVASVGGADGSLEFVTFADGSQLACAGLLVPVVLHQRSTLAEQLGAVAAAPGDLAADAIEIDTMFSTTAPGAFAAGDVAGSMPTVANAVAAGNFAAAMMVMSLATEGNHG